MQFPWTDQREKVFLDRYALRRGDEVIETVPPHMWDRVAAAMAHNRSEEWEFQDLLEDWKFLPAGRILAGAGSEQHSATWYNCFVLGLDPTNKSHGKDSRDAILNTTSKMVEINCRGGGVGINWSALRPDRSHVRGVQGTSTGPIGWMRGADALADQVRQGGSRTAALMFMMNDWHPDIFQFVMSERFRRANFSVAISDLFMSILMNRGTLWMMRFPDTSDPAYDLLWDGDIQKWEEAGRRTIDQDVDIRELWEAICQSAILRGSPGLVFIDYCNHMSTSKERLSCTNPCGEQPLPEYGSCNLGSVNLVAFASRNGDIDRQALAKTIESGIKFLDNVIDKSPALFPEIDDLQRKYRRIGLGTMGLADLLVLNKIRYGSPESLEFIDELYDFIKRQAYLANSRLADERGSAPMFSVGNFINSPYGSQFEDMGIMRLRNTAVLTQAPTGTISILAGVSSGIEPVFSSEYTRTDATGTYQVKHPLFKGRKRSYHVTAYDIPPEEHVLVQSKLQEHIDSSISKTINLPSDATEKDVDKIFKMAYEHKCKGITIYRGGSEDDVLLCKVCEV